MASYIKSLIFLLLGLISQQGLAQIYVAPDGDDNNPGTIGSPKKTIQAAADNLTSGDTLFLRGGLYHEEVVLNNKTASELNPIVFQAYKDEKPIIDGTVSLEDIKAPGANWELASDTFPGTENIYKLKIEKDIWQLFVRQPEFMAVPNAVGGELADYRMQVIARWPNGKTNPCDPLQRKENSTEAAASTWWSFTTTWAFASHPETNHTQLVNAPFRFDLAGTGKSFKGGTAIVSAIQQGPANIPVNILEHEAGSNLVQHSGIDESQGIYKYPSDHGPSFIIQHLWALDSPGEWYYDLESKTVYLWPEDGGDPNGKDIRGKTQTYGIDLLDCEHIEFNGIGLFGTTMKLEGEYISFTDGAISYPDMPKTLLGVYGVEVSAINARQCKYFTIRNCVVEYSQYHIIEVKNVGSVFDNNYFHHLAMTGLGATGCFLNVNTFTRNTLETIGNRAAVKCNSSPESGRIQSYNILDGWGFLYANDGVGFQTSQGGSRNSVRSYNWFIRSEKAGHRYDGPDEGYPGQPTLGMSHHLVGLRTKSVTNNIKGDYNEAYNYLGINSTSEHGDIAVRFNVETGVGNEHSILRNCAADGINIGKWHPLPCINSNNWDASKLGGSMMDFHPAADLFDFRPKAGAPLLNAGYDVPGITDGFLGSAPDIGAYEWGDDTYWIPGYQKSSTSRPIPYDGAENLPLNRDLMFLHAYQSNEAILYVGTSKDALSNASFANSKEPGDADFLADEVVRIMLDSGRNIVTPAMIMGNPNNYDPAPYLLVDDPLVGLAPNQTYYWRVDAVYKEGELVKGELWSFSTGNQSYVVQFKLFTEKDGVVEPAEGASAEITSNIFKADSAGNTYGARLSPGTYKYLFRKKGYLSITDSISLHADTVITDTLAYTNYNVEVLVQDIDTKEGIEGALVKIGDKELIADNSGTVQFTSIDYADYFLTASKDKYKPSEGMEVEIYSDTTFTIYLTNDYRSGQFSILDRANGEPVYRAAIRSSVESGMTNNLGVVTMNKIYPGLWKFSIEHKDYFDLTDSIAVVSDTSLTVLLTRKAADVQFIISDRNGPVENAKLMLDNWSGTSNNMGQARFYNQLARQEHVYTIETDNHNPVTETFYLELDTLIQVLLWPLGDERSVPDQDILIYPNPAGDELFMENIYNACEVHLVRPDGITVLVEKLHGAEHRLDLSDQSSGIYFLKVITEKGYKQQKIMIK